MNFIDSLTPKDTEEIRPGLFIKKTRKGYRVINPIAWNGKLRTKEQLKTIINLRTIFTIALVIFIAFSYYTDVKNCEAFQSNPCIYLTNLSSYCLSLGESENQNFFFRGGDQDETRNNNSLQGNP